MILLSTTIQFFNCFLTRNDERTNVSVSDFLDGVISLEEIDRYAENTYGAYSLIEMLMPNQNPNQNSLDRIVGFANYRDKKPYLGNRGTDQMDEITEDILELTTCIFIPTYHLAVIEYNHFGARPKHIEEYLNSFLPKEEDNHWTIEIIPIETATKIEEIRESRDIRNIEIKLDLLSKQTNIFEVKEVPQSITYQMLSQSVNAYKEIGANVATISFGQGRFRSSPMDFSNLIELLTLLDLESDIFASIKVRYKSSRTRKLETADLKNEGLLKRVIMEEDNSTAFEAVGVAISNYYYEESNRLANQEYRKYITGFVNTELPIIDNYKQTIKEIS